MYLDKKGQEMIGFIGRSIGVGLGFWLAWYAAASAGFVFTWYIVGFFFLLGCVTGSLIEFLSTWFRGLGKDKKGNTNE